MVTGRNCETLGEGDRKLRWQESGLCARLAPIHRRPSGKPGISGPRFRHLEQERAFGTIPEVLSSSDTMTSCTANWVLAEKPCGFTQGGFPGRASSRQQCLPTRQGKAGWQKGRLLLALIGPHPHPTCFPLGITPVIATKE